MTLTVVREIVTTITSIVLFSTTPNASFLDNYYRDTLRGRNVYTYVKDTTNVDTPSNIAGFLDRYIKYDLLNDAHDGHPGPDYMQNPLETYLVGEGDCEDYANFACNFLRKNNYQAQVVAIHGKNFDHAVCVYVDGKFRVISNDVPNRFFSTIKEIAEYYTKDYEIIEFLEEDILDGRNYKIDFSSDRNGKSTGKTKFPLVIK